MLSPAQIGDFRRDDYHVVRGLLPTTRFTEGDAALAALALRPPSGRSERISCEDRPRGHSRALRRADHRERCFADTWVDMPPDHARASGRVHPCKV